MLSLCENWLRVKATSMNLCGRKPAEQPGRPQRHTWHGRSSGDRLGLRQPRVDCETGKAELKGSRGRLGTPSKGSENQLNCRQNPMDTSVVHFPGGKDMRFRKVVRRSVTY